MNRNLEKSSSKSSSKWWAVFAGLTTFEVVLLVKILTSEANVAILFAVAIVTILLILILRIDDLGSVIATTNKLEVYLNNVSQRQEKTEKRQDEAQEIIKAITIALEGIVTSYERDHLEKLKLENDDTVEFGEIFFTELERLDAIGFITPIKYPGILAIKQEHQNYNRVFHLREYLKLTEKGDNYLKIVHQSNCWKNLGFIQMVSCENTMS